MDCVNRPFPPEGTSKHRLDPITLGWAAPGGSGAAARAFGCHTCCLGFEVGARPFHCPINPRTKGFATWRR